MPSLDEMKKQLSVIKDKHDRALRDLAVAENQLAMAEKALKEEFGVETLEQGQAMMATLQKKIDAAQEQWAVLMKEVQDGVALAES